VLRGSCGYLGKKIHGKLPDIGWEGVTMDIRHWLPRAVNVAESWSEQFGPFRSHASHKISDDVFEQFGNRMGDNYPFFHPRHAGQMVKLPHPAPIVGCLTTNSATANLKVHLPFVIDMETHAECYSQRFAPDIPIRGQFVKRVSTPCDDLAAANG
jgi:hypothetical protein